MVHDSFQNGRLFWYLIGGSGQIVKDEMAERALQVTQFFLDVRW